MLESWECVSRAACVMVPAAASESTESAPMQQQDEQQTPSSGSECSDPTAVAKATAAKGRPLFPKEARSHAKLALQAARAGSLPALTQRYSVRITRCEESATGFNLIILILYIPI